MKKKHRSLLVFFVLLVLAIVVAGCSGSASNEKPNDTNNDPAPSSGNDSNENEEPETETDPDPVTIGIRVQGIFTNEENFEKYYREPLKEVYPHITLEMVPGDMGTMEDQILAGTVPDIYAGWNGNLTEIMEMELAADILPYAEITGSDLTRFVPTTLDSATVDGKLYGLPYAQQFNALYYNKDIFDLFGVDYPEDGMTWEETIELARKVTGERNGVQYKGLAPGAFFRLLTPLSLGSLVEYGTNKNLIPENRDDLYTVFKTAYDIYSIPGNAPEDLEAIRTEGSLTEFAQGSVAMLATVNRVASFGDVNWGVAQYPSYPQAPNTYGAVDAHYHFLFSTSKNPVEAFKVMDFFASPEMQKLLASEAGQFTVMNDVDTMQEFAQNNEHTSEIDFSGVFKSRPAESPILHSSMIDVQNLLTDKMIEVLQGKDINTAISEAEQEVDALIANFSGSQ